MTITLGDSTEYLGYFAHREPRIFAGFSSLSVMVDYIEHAPSYANSHDGRELGWQTGNGSYYGTWDMSEAIAMAIDVGWPEGAKLAARVIDIFSQEHATRKSRSPAVAGGNPSVGRMLAGNPLHMSKRARLPSQRIITLFVELFINSNVTKEAAILRAAVIAAIVDTTERAGYSCNVIGVDYSMHRSEPMLQLTVDLKHAGEALNIESMVFALGHPSMCRRFTSAVAVQSEAFRECWRTGHGRAGAAFTEEHPPGPNEFYLKGFNKMVDPDGSNFASYARRLYQLITPKNYPVQLLTP